MRDRALIVSASMGAGHDAVAAELARRLAASGARAEVVDVLALLPLRLGALLRWWYRGVMLRAPWLYALVYRVFFVSRRAPSTSPLTVVAAAGLARAVRRVRPSLVVPVFHVAAQAAGHLRARGRLAVPSAVVLTDFAVHRLWLHPGNDRYLCPDTATSLAVTAAVGRPAFRCAPIVRPGFGAHGADVTQGADATQSADAAEVRARIGLRDGDRIVLVCAGSWGVGRVGETARLLARSGRYAPVVLCGRNERLRRRLGRLLGRAGAGAALGWRDDLADLLASAYALVDNAGGLTCREAFAAGVPVVTYRPIAGHGRDGVLAMARAGVSVHARRRADLLRALDRLEPGLPGRAALTARAAALFTSAPAESLLLPDLLLPGHAAPRPCEPAP
ncbi:UNVERIFIED_ORG: UDP-N-acetylglucosamine:LPS N-acetylglucosamine transferase [Microbispora rosea subsp. rosea]